MYGDGSLIISENPMGGFNSGRWGGRQRCENCLAIDVRYLQRQKLLDDEGEFILRWDHEGRHPSCIQVSVRARDVVLAYSTASGERHSDPIELVRTLCHYGGSRAWFRCPNCNRLAAKLYLRDDRFLCRQCHDLRYASQLTAKVERPRIIAQRIRRSLGASANLALPFPFKPKGMRWRTYYRLRAKGERYETRAIAGLRTFLDRLKGRMRA